MSDARFKLYRPGRAAYAPRRTQNEWSSVRTLLTTLHTQNMSRKLMREALAEKGFYVTLSQLNKKMMEWNLMPRGSRISINSLGEDSTLSLPTISTHPGRTDSSSPWRDPQHFRPPHCQPHVSPQLGAYDMEMDSFRIAATGNDWEDDRSREFSCFEGSPYRSSKSSNLASSTTSDWASVPTRLGMGSTNSIRTMSTSETSQSLFSPVDHFTTNLRGLEQRARVLEKLKAVELTDGQLPLESCCCENFFTRKGPFAFWRGLYGMLCGGHQEAGTLKHAIGLIRMREEAAQDRPIDQMLIEAITFYLRLLARRDVENYVAFAIAIQLARRFDYRNDHQSHKNGKGKKSAAVMMCDERYHKSRLLPFITLKDSERYDDLYEYGPEPFTHILHRLEKGATGWMPTMLQDCYSVLAKFRHKVVGVLHEHLACPRCHRLTCICSSSRQLDMNKATLLEIAADISCILTRHADSVRWRMNEMMSACQGSIIFDAVGLMTARACAGAMLKMPKNFSIDAQYIACIDSLFGFDGRQVGLEGMELVRREFLRACWVCDPKQAIFGPQGLHLNLCRGGRIWGVLNSSITDFDRILPRDAARIEITAVNNLDRLPGYDDEQPSNHSTKSSQPESRLLNSASTRTSRSDYSRYHSSCGSAWSGHLSRDSWKLETLMEIDDGMANLRLNQEERRTRVPKARTTHQREKWSWTAL